MTAAGDPRPGADPFRLMLLGLAALTVASGAAELAMERHWGDPVKLVPWLMLGLLTLGIAGIAFLPSRATVLAARLLAAVAVGASAYGIWAHIDENHKAGPLDFRYSASWAQMSAREQWMKAITKTVGPAPVLAPALLAMAGLCLAGSTYAHPALAHAAARRRIPGRPPVES